MTKGYISVQHTVWCGVCGNWEQVDEGKRKNAVALFRRMGWKNTKKNSWTCPKCRGKKA